MRSIIATTAVCLALCLQHPVAAQQPSGMATGQLICSDPASSLMWKIQGRNSLVYLFGSIHVGKSDFYPLPPVIESAFQEAEQLVFEVDPQSAADAEVVAQIMARGMLQDGKTLNDLISQPVMSNLVMTLTSLGLPPDNFMNFQPWFLIMVLTNLQMASLGYLPDHGIERYLIGKKTNRARILELESMTEQIGMLEQLNGETFLAYTLEEFEDSKEQIQQMIDAWRCADLEQLQNILFSELAAEAENNPEMQKLMEMLFFDRNKKMSAGIREYLEHGRDDYFVVVGAGHRIGDRSIIDILDDQYQVTAVRLQ